MRASVIFFVGVVAFAGCAPAASTLPSKAPVPTAAPLAVGEFTSHGVATTLDARGAGESVSGTMTMSDSGQNATVALECSRATDSGLLMIGGLVTASTFTEWFPKGHRVAIVLKRGSPVEAIWYVVLPGDKPIESCPVLLKDHLTEPLDGLEPIEGTVQLGS